MFKWLKRKSSDVTIRQSQPPEAPIPKVAPNPAPDKALQPVAIETQIAHGMQLFHAGEYASAGNVFKAVLQRDPRNLTALYQTVSVRLSLSEFAAAKTACECALKILPDHPELILLSAYVAKRSTEHEASLAILLRLQAIHPDFPDLDIKIAEQYATLGRGAEAISAMDRAITRDPEELSRKSVRLFYLNYFGLLSRSEMFEEHRKWGQMIDEGFASLRKPLAVDRHPDRALRIGLVSGDLRNHAVALFIEGYLREHDRINFPIVCFDVSPHAEDSVTAQLRGMVDGWYRVASMNDDALADEIRRQKIDILVDLSGHTMFNRLLVFARKPAPVQVSWFGYMNTTGLTSIDYRITDPGHDPDSDAQKYFSEKLFYIPSLACFSPHPSSPEVSQSPFTRQGHVTFVSANQWTKVTENVIEAWTAILCDESRPHLRICANGAASAAFCDGVAAQFVRRGALREQIEFQPVLPMAEFLASFSEVDVALDPFPYGGGTTTLHTIWMGVPIIALQGDTELGRATPTMLAGFGLLDFVASTVEEYRDKAIALARDPSRLVGIRANLRHRMADSPALDAKGLTRNVENAFRTMWHNYCASVTETSQADASVK